MSQSEKIQQLLTSRWQHKYFCKLAILDHLHECLAKDSYLKATDAAKDMPGYAALDKELMDLNILLELYFSDQSALKTKRLDKFLTKINE